MAILNNGRRSVATNGEGFWGSADPRRQHSDGVTMMQRLQYATPQRVWSEQWNHLPYATGRPDIHTHQTGGNSLAK